MKLSSNNVYNYIKKDNQNIKYINENKKYKLIHYYFLNTTFVNNYINKC